MVSRWWEYAMSPAVAELSAHKSRIPRTSTCQSSYIYRVSLKHALTHIRMHLYIYILSIYPSINLSIYINIYPKVILSMMIQFINCEKQPLFWNDFPYQPWWHIDPMKWLISSDFTTRSTRPGEYPMLVQPPMVSSWTPIDSPCTSGRRLDRRRTHPGDYPASQRHGYGKASYFEYR